MRPFVVTRSYSQPNALASFPVSIADCAAMRYNTTHNQSWSQIPSYADMAYYYPGLPSTGAWSGVYRDLMSFRSSDDVDAARDAFRTLVWQTTGMVSGTYDRLTLNVSGTHDEYELDMPYWLSTSRCWLYHTSVTPSGVLLIVHGGHDNHGPLHAQLIPIRQEALALGHDVLVCSMPGQSVNIPAGPHPWLSTVNGPMSVHANIAFYDKCFLGHTSVGGSFGIPPESGLHVFVAPVHRMINAIGGNYDRVVMTGLSGGASTAVWCAALDPRIVAVCAVAGSGVACRFSYYQTPAFNFGDVENGVRSWMEAANEEEMLTMIADGGRRAMIVIDRNDNVAFNDVDMNRYGPAAMYEAALVGGRLTYRSDPTSVHEWSTETKRRIFGELVLESPVLSQAELMASVLVEATARAASAKILSLTSISDLVEDAGTISVYSETELVDSSVSGSRVSFVDDATGTSVVGSYE